MNHSREEHERINREQEERLEQRFDKLYDGPRCRGIVKNMLNFVTGHYHTHLTTYDPKEQDNDYINDKYGDSGVA